MNRSIPTQTIGLILASIVVVFIGTQALSVESAKKEQTSLQAIGTLSILVTPVPTSVGTEFVSITLNAPGEYDFTGWKIVTESGYTHIIDAPSVESRNQLIVCGEEVAGVECTDFFADTNVLTDGTGSVEMYDTADSLISTISYEGLTAGQAKRTAPDFRTTVYAGNASIEFCRATNQGDFTDHKGNASTIVAGKAHADPTGASIIPSFYYNFGDGIGYYAGLNWPDTTGLFTNNCQSI